MIGLPLPRGVGELPLDQQAGPVRFDPAVEPAPPPDQRLVGHLDRYLDRDIRIARGRDQAGVGQAADHGLHGQRIGAGRDQFVESGTTLGVLAPLAGLG